MYMAPVTGGRMFDELWRLVLEDVLHDAQTPTAILPLLLVCKTWKACGTSLLYRHLQFSTPGALKAFYEHLFTKAIDGQFPGLYTHSISLATMPTMDPSSLPLQLGRILRYVPNLRSFQAPTIDICSTTLEPLGLAAQASLQELAVTLCCQESDGAMNLALLSRFTSLKRLKVNVHWGADSVLFPISRVPGFHMPALVELAWSSSAFAPVPEFLTFLSRCSFPALTKVELDLPFLSWDGTCALVPFFKKAGAQLRHLSLNAPDAALLPSTLFPLTPALHTLDLCAGAPILETIRVMPPSVVQLGVQVDMSEGGRRLLQFLDEWMAERESETRPAGCAGQALRRVQLSMKVPNAFEWRTIGAMAPLFAGQMMSRAIGLAAHGIHLLDSSGNTVIVVPSGNLAAF